MATEGNGRFIATSNNESSTSHHESATMVREEVLNAEAGHPGDILCCGDAGLDPGIQHGTRTNGRQELVQISQDQNTTSIQNNMSCSSGDEAGELSPNSSAQMCTPTTGEEKLLSSLSKLSIRDKKPTKLDNSTVVEPLKAYSETNQTVTPCLSPSSVQASLPAPGCTQETTRKANKSQGHDQADYDTNMKQKGVSSNVSTEPSSDLAQFLLRESSRMQSVLNPETESRSMNPDLGQETTASSGCLPVPTDSSGMQSVHTSKTEFRNMNPDLGPETTAPSDCSPVPTDSSEMESVHTSVTESRSINQDLRPETTAPSESVPFPTDGSEMQSVHTSETESRSTNQDQERETTALSECVPVPMHSSEGQSVYTPQTDSNCPYPGLESETTTQSECVPVPTAAGDASGSADHIRTVSVGDITVPHTVRDASKQCGQRDADDAYNQLFLECYPEYKDKVYRVPPLSFSHSPYVSSRRSGDLHLNSSDTFQLYGTTRTDVRGDIAEYIVTRCIEDLLNSWVVDKFPAFVITSFQFENFCNKVNMPPSTDKNKYVKALNNSSNTSPEHKDGEHDLLIVHYQYGIIFIQVKSCEETTDPNNTVKKAIDQTKADEKFFEANFKDLQTKVSVKSAIALPDKKKSNLEDHYKLTANRIKAYYNPDGLKRCLFFEDLPCKGDDEAVQADKKQNMLNWWQSIIKNCRGFTSFDDYKRVVARYVGFKSTVQIPVTRPLAYDTDAQEGRHLSHCVSEIGNRYMNIVLTPQQVYILNTNLSRLIIRGQYGAGKTVMLILKVRELLKELKEVCVISMSPSPLIHVLEQSIKYDMDRIYCDRIRFETALDQIQLTRVLERCSEERCSIFIDEFPSFVSTNKGLQQTIQDFPSGLMFWCIMSRERNDKMSRGPHRLFNLFHQSELRFREVVMNKILRCPPSVQSYVPTFSQKREKLIFKYSKNKLETEGPKKYMASHFHSLGLFTTQTRHLAVGSPLESSLSWSDVVVLEPEPATRPFYSLLVKLKIPLLRVSNIVHFSKMHLDKIKSGITNMSTYTYSFVGFQNVQRVADIAGTDCAIYIKGAKGGQVEQLDNTVVAVAKFLHENGFINETITRESRTLQAESNVEPRKWCDVIFLDAGEVAKPICYSFLESLGVPLVTPSSIDVMFQDAVLYTNKSNYEGFQRKESITFGNGEVIANEEEKMCMDGPETINIDHTDHAGSVEACDSCKVTLEQILHGLGLISAHVVGTGTDRVSRPSTLEAASEQLRHSVQPSDASGMSHNLLALAQNPRQDLSFADLVIIDERHNPKSVVRLFQRCGIPVVDKLDSVSLDAEEAFPSDTKVLCTKGHLYKGLERKVVVIIKGQSRGMTPVVRNGIMEDFIEMSLTRCASQLIVIRTKQ